MILYMPPYPITSNDANGQTRIIPKHINPIRMSQDMRV